MERGVEKRRITLLSNVNMSSVSRRLSREAEVHQPSGYGNELGAMMNPNSDYNQFDPEITFLIIDLAELVEHEFEKDVVEAHVEQWYATLAEALRPERIYYVSDVCLFSPELEAADLLTDRVTLENLWMDRLDTLCEKFANVRKFPYRRMIEQLGEENAFSMKMWYMGKILLSNEAQKRLAELILRYVRMEYRTPKKVLVLDLDNTLWGGLAGEHEQSPVALSEDHGGLAYKNHQRVIRQMQKQGVLLAIVSKNNEADAEEILKHHPHMVLKPEHFAAKRINWNAKSENILEIAQELNLGVDSFVFWDDSPQERMEVAQMLPQVTVPDFPENPEELAPAMTNIYHDYFEKPVLTKEDLDKTTQYAENAKRMELKKTTGNFYEYLKELKIVVTRVEADKHLKRLEDMVNKTNQFNLTTVRHTMSELQQILSDPYQKLFAYRVEDRFGDNGIVAAVIVDMSQSVPTIEEFLMSCRVMGKNVEYGILKDVELEMLDEHFTKLRGYYIPTAKNKPVEDFYAKAGYEMLGERADGTKVYEVDLTKAPLREFVGQMVLENIKIKDIMV
ncbi:MAG: HAD-IIIC family phosphatase [Lachnospiraceae bacterium]|nr:HAD-IIIC family phosphatase [Lachnospiraceae bacterium]